MKIMQVIPYFCFGGAETMCESLTYELTKLGHEVCVVCLLPERTPISRRMEEAGIRILFLDKNLLQADSLSFHPNDCRGTVVIHREDFERYLQCVGNIVEWIDLY